jgi:HK97 gp10 family phage protein
MPVSSTVSGVEEANLALEDFSKKTMARAVRKGSRAGCQVIAAAARATAPYRTGKLRAGIKVRALPRSRKYIGTRVTIDSVYYAPFVEYGTKHPGAARRRTTFGLRAYHAALRLAGVAHGGMKARHYLKNAADATKAAALNVAREVIKAELGKYAT